MTKYYEQIDEITGLVIRRENEDGSVSFIPADKSNSEYQKYLQWKEGLNGDNI